MGRAGPKHLSKRAAVELRVQLYFVEDQDAIRARLPLHLRRGGVHIVLTQDGEKPVLIVGFRPDRLVGLVALRAAQVPVLPSSRPDAARFTRSITALPPRRR